MSDEQKKANMRGIWEEQLNKLSLTSLAIIALTMTEPPVESPQGHVHGVSLEMLGAIVAADKKKDDRIKELEVAIAKQKQENETLRAFIVNELGGFPDGAPAKKQRQ